MTGEELNKALLIERFGPRPKRTRTAVVVVQEPVYDDSTITVRRRQRDLEEADRESTWGQERRIGWSS